MKARAARQGGERRRSRGARGSPLPPAVTGVPQHPRPGALNRAVRRLPGLSTTNRRFRDGRRDRPAGRHATRTGMGILASYTLTYLESPPFSPGMGILASYTLTYRWNGRETRGMRQPPAPAAGHTRPGNGPGPAIAWYASSSPKAGPGGAPAPARRRCGSGSGDPPVSRPAPARAGPPEAPRAPQRPCAPSDGVRTPAAPQIGSQRNFRGGAAARRIRRFRRFHRFHRIRRQEGMGVFA